MHTVAPFPNTSEATIDSLHSTPSPRRVRARLTTPQKELGVTTHAGRCSAATRKVTFSLPIQNPPPSARDAFSYHYTLQNTHAVMQG